MTKLLSSKEVLKALKNAGFTAVSQKGSHIKLKNAGGVGNRVVILPNHKEIAVGTLKSIVRQAGINLDRLIKYIE